MLRGGGMKAGSGTINRAAARQPTGEGDMKTRSRAGNPGPEKKADMKGAIDSEARTGNVLGVACSHLKSMHPQGYDDKGPHRSDPWMSRSKK